MKKFVNSIYSIFEKLDGFFYYILFFLLSFLLLTFVFPNFIFLAETYFSKDTFKNGVFNYQSNLSALIIFQKVYGENNLIMKFYQSISSGSWLSFMAWLEVSFVVILCVIILGVFIFVGITLMTTSVIMDWKERADFLFRTSFFFILLSPVSMLLFTCIVFNLIFDVSTFIHFYWGLWQILGLVFSIPVLVFSLWAFYIVTKKLFKRIHNEVKDADWDYTGSIHYKLTDNLNFTKANSKNINWYIKIINWKYSKPALVLTIFTQFFLWKPIVFILGLIVQISCLTIFNGINWSDLLIVSILLLVFTIIQLFFIIWSTIISFKDYLDSVNNFKETSKENKLKELKNLLDNIIFNDYISIARDEFKLSYSEKATSGVFKQKDSRKIKISFNNIKFKFTEKIDYKKYFKKNQPPKEIFYYEFEDKFANHFNFGKFKEIIDHKDYFLPKITYLEIRSIMKWFLKNIEKKYVTNYDILGDEFLDKKNKIKKIDQTELQSFFDQYSGFDKSLIAEEVSNVEKKIYSRLKILFYFAREWELLKNKKYDAKFINEYFEKYTKIEKEDYKNYKQDYDYEEQKRSWDLNSVEGALKFFDIKLEELNERIVKTKWRMKMKVHHSDTGARGPLNEEEAIKANNYKDILLKYISDHNIN